jgi:hypothetical protein
MGRLGPGLVAALFATLLLAPGPAAAAPGPASGTTLPYFGSLAGRQLSSTPSVVLSTPAGRATGVQYLVTFANDLGLAGNAGTITLTAPAGTVFANSGIDVRDLTTDTDLGGTAGPTLTDSGATATWTVDGNGVPAGHQIRLTVTAVTNPAAGSYTLGVSTSADTAIAYTPAYAVSTAQAVLSPAVSLSTTAAGATGVTYRVSFTTSSTGGLAGGNGVIAIAAPSGTVIPNRAIDVFDVTDGTDLGATFGPALTDSGASAAWVVDGNGVPAGHEIRLTITGVTNPAAGSDQLGVSTSSDVVADTGVYGVSAGRVIGSPAVSLSTTAAGATGVTYRVSFTTSSTGGLAAGNGVIMIAAPAGTVIPNRGVDVYDLTSDTDLGGTNGPALTDSGASAAWVVGGIGVPAGHEIRVTITGVTNPAVGSDQLGVSTSSDAVVADTGVYGVTAGRVIGSPAVSLTSSAAGVPGVTYRVSFTTSSTGGLAGGNGVIMIAAPAGTVIPNRGVDVYDLTTDIDLGGTYGPALTNSGASAAWTVGSNGVAGGHEIELTITGVTNPAVGSDQLSVSTSSDATPAKTGVYGVTAGRVIGSPAVSLTTSAAGATGVTYRVSFTTSSTGDLAGGNGTITIAAAPGTVIPNRGVDVYDLTSDADLGGTYGPTLTDSGATAVWTVDANGVAAGHEIELTITGVTNPAAGSGQLSISTSSDATVSKTGFYGISAPRATSSAEVDLTNAGPAAIGTYRVTFTTSSTGALAGGNGTITLSAPAGTVFPNAGLDVFDLTTGTDLGETFGPTLAGGGASATWTVGANGVPAGHQIELVLTGVTNPGAGSYHLGVSTSSDLAVVQSEGYAIS